MKPGMSIEGAAARMQTLAGGIASEHPDTNAGWGVRLSPLSDEISRTSRLELLLVFAAMFCLLLLVCANVASLAIARGSAVRGKSRFASRSARAAAVSPDS